MELYGLKEGVELHDLVKKVGLYCLKEGMELHDLEKRVDLGP